MSDVPAAVLIRDPDWDGLPVSFRLALRRCLVCRACVRLRPIGGAPTIFYWWPGGWMSVAVMLEPECSWEPPRLAFETDFIGTPWRSYDVPPAGRRLLVVKRTLSLGRGQIHLVQNRLPCLEGKRGEEGRAGNRAPKPPRRSGVGLPASSLPRTESRLAMHSPSQTSETT